MVAGIRIHTHIFTPTMRRNITGSSRSLRNSILRRTPTFSGILYGHRLNDADFRYSLSRLPEHQETEEEVGPGEWGRLQNAVCGLVQKQPLPNGMLTSLHDDVRALQRSKAGPFIREYLETRILASAGEIMRAEVTEASDLEQAIRGTWEHFYSHVLPMLEAIFIQIKGQRLTIRQTGLLGFRDHVVLPLFTGLASILEAAGPESTHPQLRQMLLVLQSVTECYPPSEKRLQLEALVARGVSPYLGFRGLYENGHPEPVVISGELEVAQQRRPSVVNDPRLLLRPLSVSGVGHRADTLSELFTFSADRQRQRRHRFLS